MEMQDELWNPTLEEVDYVLGAAQRGPIPAPQAAIELARDYGYDAIVQVIEGLQVAGLETEQDDDAPFGEWLLTEREVGLVVTCIEWGLE